MIVADHDIYFTGICGFQISDCTIVYNVGNITLLDCSANPKPIISYCKIVGKVVLYSFQV